MQPIIYDRGLIQAVTNAQNFIAQTFPGARLLESHNVSLDECVNLSIVIEVEESVLQFPCYCGLELMRVIINITLWKPLNREIVKYWLVLALFKSAGKENQESKPSLNISD